jgi:hypothetical protein
LKDNCSAGSKTNKHRKEEHEIYCKHTWMDDRVSLRHDFGDWTMLINDEAELMARFEHVYV